MNFANIYGKYKIIIWPLAVGTSSVIVLALVVIPQLLTYFNINNKISEIQNRSSVLEAKAVELAQINEVEAQKDLQTVLAVLPTDPDVPRAMTILQQYVASSGLELKSSSFVPGKSKDSFQLSIVVLGQIQSLRNFFISLQEAPRLFQVEAVSVQFQKNKATLEAEIPIVVFYQAMPSSVGALDQPTPKLSAVEQQLLSKLSAIVSRNDMGASQVSFSATPQTSQIPLGKSDPFQ